MLDIVSEVRGDKISYNHSIKYDVSPEEYTTHCHDRCELIFFIHGDVSYIAEGRSYRLKRGDVVLSRPSLMHCILPNAGTAYERYDVILDHTSLPECIWRKIKTGRDVYKCADNALIFELFSKLDDYFGKFSDEDYARLAFNITEEIIFNLSLIESNDDEASTNPIIDRALEYIRENLTTVSGVEEICAALYITKSHLHHLFSKHLQMTPLKYITSKRLLLARRKIRRGEKPTEVFIECGFEDYATFFRNYKKYFGYSPSVEIKVKEVRERLF